MKIYDMGAFCWDLRPTSFIPVLRMWQNVTRTQAEFRENLDKTYKMYIIHRTNLGHGQGDAKLNTHAWK